MCPNRRPDDNDSHFYHQNNGNVGETSPTLLAGLQNDESLAMITFFEIYTKLVRVWCHRANKKYYNAIPHEDREDITSQVVTKAIQKLLDKNNEPIKSLRGYLYRITENTIIDFLRKKKQLKPVWQLMPDSDFFQSQPDNDESLDLSDEQQDRLILLEEIIKRIKPTIKAEHWEIYQQTVVEGKDSEEVAKITKRTGTGVRQIKKRILDRIREEYKMLGMENE